MINKTKKKNQIETKRIPGVTSWPICRGVGCPLAPGFSFGIFI